MKKILYIILFFSAHWHHGQEISDLYESTNSAVVLIKTVQPELVGQGEQKYMIGLEGLGSGFVVSLSGEIMTASHVVQTAEEILVVFPDGEEIPAKVVYSFPAADVALIKLVRPKSTPLSVVKMADSDDVRIGDQVFIIGAPFGLGHSLSVGYVSGKHSRKNVASGFVTTEFIQTDAAINEGSSGAPMFNRKGEVIGIASFILSHSQGFQGLGFAATSNIAQKLLNKDHALWTGIDAILISKTMAEILNVPQSGGILVEKVATASLGNSMGLKGGSYTILIEGEELMVGGDIILAVENIPLVNEDNLLKVWQLLLGLKKGANLTFTILRKGRILELTGTMP